jgi:hypothetical protein
MPEALSTQVSAPQCAGLPQEARGADCRRGHAQRVFFLNASRKTRSHSRRKKRAETPLQNDSLPFTMNGLLMLPALAVVVVIRGSLNEVASQVNVRGSKVFFNSALDQSSWKRGDGIHQAHPSACS